MEDAGKHMLIPQDGSDIYAHLPTLVLQYRGETHEVPLFLYLRIECMTIAP